MKTSRKKVVAKRGMNRPPPATTKTMKVRSSTKAEPITKRESDPLAVYRSKRDFAITSEPPPDRLRKRSTNLEFVVQKHDARRLHYDVRIEIAGAMMSWAVPKGPSFDPAVKRLAVETEDHPTAYNRFEGRIPDGEYGAGDVLIWDRGTYETVPPGQELAMRKKGHIVARFAGEKLVGDWHFVRTRSKSGSVNRSETTKSQWLMFKAKDEHADPTLDIVASSPESVVSGAKATRGPRRTAKSLTLTDLLRVVGDPMRAIATATIDDPADFYYEIKYDGYRLLAARANGVVRLQTRKRNDWTKRFQPIADAVAKLAVRDVVLDGEACILDPQGRSSFELLQSWQGGEQDAGELVFAAFDILWLDGRDLRELPIEDRRKLAADLLADAEAPLAFSKSLDGPLRDLTESARAGGLEGLIAKRKASPYSSGGSGAWWKLKFRKRQEFAVAGYLPLKGGDNEVGALLIAVATKRGQFKYVGRVGTGFTQSTRKKLADGIDAHRVKASKVQGAPTLKDAHWSEVKLVAEVEFAEWTSAGAVRAPSFLGLRDDKSPNDCVREVEVVSPRESSTDRSGRSPNISHPTKVLFPKDGYTKADIAAYYDAVAEVALPHLRGRPLALQRWPNGIEGKAWYQQNAPDQVPDFVRLVGVDPDHPQKKHIVADNAETLAWLANLAAITIHQWASRAPEIAHSNDEILRMLDLPDYVVFDLDPGRGPWSDVIDVAIRIRGLLEQLELTSVVKTSGKRGLHILVPIARRHPNKRVVDFAEKIALTVADSLPAVATIERMIAKRKGRLYIDVHQNGFGKTIVAPYTLRALDGAPVSTPLKWSEVTHKLDPRSFTLRTVLKRIAKHGDLLAPVLGGKQMLPHV